MKIAMVLAYIGIGVLAFFIFMQNREINRLEALIPKTPSTPNTNPDNSGENNAGRSAVSGGQLWKELQDSVSDMKVDLTFKNK
jgi:hypothetical protein